MIALLFLSGCTGVVPGIGYHTEDGYYKNFIGKKYEVISPLQVLKYTYFGGEHFLAKADYWETKEVKKIADVPVGAIIIGDHVTRIQHIALGDTHSYLGKFQTRGIFNGGFKLNSFMEWKTKNASRKEKNFNNDFLGLNAEYFKEISIP